MINRAILPVVKGIPLQIRQLFSNLISNSLKFSERAPVITIRGRELPAEDVKKNPALDSSVQYSEIQFTDNGIGFEQQYATQIFTIFQRLNSRVTYSGTGIGLALCKKIVDNHRGSISAFGELNQGATFKVTLPIA